MKAGVIQEMINDFRNGDYDLTDNGECKPGCSECCGRFLPVSNNEIVRIRRYIEKHNIKPCRHGLMLRNIPLDFNCPFLDESKDKEKCRIYTARPLICKLYKCDQNMDKEAEMQFAKQANFPIDMWRVFFPDSKEADLSMLFKEEKKVI